MPPVPPSPTPMVQTRRNLKLQFVLIGSNFQLRKEMRSRRIDKAAESSGLYAGETG